MYSPGFVSEIPKNANPRAVGGTTRSANVYVPRFVVIRAVTGELVPSRLATVRFAPNSV